MPGVRAVDFRLGLSVILGLQTMIYRLASNHTSRRVGGLGPNPEPSRDARWDERAKSHRFKD